MERLQETFPSGHEMDLFPEPPLLNVAERSKKRLSSISGFEIGVKRGSVIRFLMGKGIVLQPLNTFPCFQLGRIFFHVFSHFSNPKEYSYTLNSTSLQQEYPLKVYANEITKSRTESKTYVQNGMVQRKCLNDDLIIDTK